MKVAIISRQKISNSNPAGEHFAIKSGLPLIPGHSLANLASYNAPLDVVTLAPESAIRQPMNPPKI